MRQAIKNAKRIVIKVGTSTLTYPNGGLNLRFIGRLAWVLADLKNSGMEVVLVSSGAIGVGAERLGLTSRPRDTKGKQAAAAVGQAVLMQIYQNLFMEYNQKVAQILFTKDILEDSVRKQNAENTFETLFELGVIPIVNENDTVATYEIEFSDNDTLSAYVSLLVKADLLIILSDTEGFCQNDPHIDPAAKIIPEITEITDKILKMAGDARTSLGTGGMATKLLAARLTMDKGIGMVIASGHDPLIITDILTGSSVGTYFYNRGGR